MAEDSIKFSNGCRLTRCLLSHWWSPWRVRALRMCPGHAQNRIAPITSLKFIGNVLFYYIKCYICNVAGCSWQSGAAHYIALGFVSSLFFLSIYIFHLSTRNVPSLSVCVQLEDSVSVTFCEIVFQEDGSFSLYTWHAGKHDHPSPRYTDP